MKTKYWESEKIYIIQRDLQKMIDDKEVKTVVSLSMTSIPKPNAQTCSCSAILIYK
jgi:hypothetical protein